LAIGLTFLRAIDAVEADTLGVPIMENVERITVNDTNNFGDELSAEARRT
jgi:hypothetical protein